MTISHHLRRRLPSAAAAAAVLVSAVMLAACGGASNTGSGSKKDPDEGIKFAQCMRDHGIQVADPQQGADGKLLLRMKIPGGGAGGPGEEKVRSAQSACQRYAPGGGRPPSPAQQAEMRDRLLSFAQCMRDHGVDMPDPQTQGGKLFVGPRSKAEARSPGFQAAHEACQHLLPARTGGSRQ